MTTPTPGEGYPQPDGTGTNTDPKPVAPPAISPEHTWFIDRGSAFDSFERFEADWVATHGTARVTDSGFDVGKAVSLDTNGDSRVRIVRELARPLDLSDLDLSLAVRLESTTRPLFEVSLVLTDVNGNRCYHTGSITPDAAGRWLRFDMGIESDDGVDRSAIAELWVEHYAGDAETRFTVDDLRTVRKPDVGYVIFTFDDQGSTDYTTAYDVLSAYGYPGVCYPPINQVTATSTPSIAQYREMRAAGWDIGGHTLDHERLSEYSRDDQVRILRQNADQLREKKLAGKLLHFRTPSNDYDAATLDVVLDHFDTCGIGAGSVTGTNLRLTDPRTIAFPAGDELNEGLEAITAAATHRQLLPLSLDMDTIDRDHLEALVQHVQFYERLGQLKVITMSDLYKRSLRQ